MHSYEKEFDFVIQRAKSLKQPARMVVAGADSENVLKAVFQAEAGGFCLPILVGDEEKISLGFGHVKFVPQKKGNISLVPYGERVHIINSKGLEYPLEDLVLTKSDTRGISNLSFADEVEFFVKEGQVLILETWRPE